MVPAIGPEPGGETGKYGGSLLDTELLEKVITMMMLSVCFLLFGKKKNLDAKR